MKNFEKDYLTLVNNVLFNGLDRPKERTGVGCKSVFAPVLFFDLRDGFFPQITCRYISAKVHEAEFNWFLGGHTNVKELHKSKVKIWDAWANADGELGPTYGHQLRNFGSTGYDQLKETISNIRNEPDSRRHVISLWAPNQLKEMLLPPCWLMFQFYVDGNKLNLLANQRSVDLILGFPYDICVFARLLLYMAEQTDLKPGIIKVQMGDAHIYNNHLDIARKLIWSDSRMLPTYRYENNLLTLINYEYKEKIEVPINI